jgi:hypothetical protein
LRSEVLDAKTFVALISPASLDSNFVLFELGARWVAQKPLIPLVVPTVSTSDLEAPLNSLNALVCDSRANLFQLVQELAKMLDVDLEPPATYAGAIDNVLLNCGESIGLPSRATYPEPLVGGTWVGWTRNMEDTYSLIIEQYRQESKEISIVGRSYKPGFKLKADWYSTSASFNIVDGCLYVSYKTTIKKGLGAVIETQGLGRLLVHGGEITGTVFDRPERVLIDGNEFWEPKFFEYRLVQIKAGEILSFEATRNTEEFSQIRRELSKRSDEWAET